MVRRCDRALEGYEEKLHLVEKFVNIRGQVQKIHELASGYHADDIVGNIQCDFRGVIIHGI